MNEAIVCWQCGKLLEGLILPMSRREECAHCGADQHVCKLCEHFDGRYCTEQRAEPPTDKEKANFCDYFKPKANAYGGGYKDKSQAAKDKLAALFGDAPPEDKNSKKEESERPLTPAEIAEQKLRKLLGGD
ncbi:hypothetical protein P2G88_01430 [Aliiglaciecola sp. CAU 1673]|uniref:hypothetical protein n=1 Tax=Aliiglaciecola sp. CAU 1673 TaxID=3032595 RepID=UPI0023D978B7|nr:hypothetical protein [Aliiglaciecola sp. CAU 1673]MDF2176913.1 hypothetical protein [Aliiglaciecola sp. CAU 1673]